LDTVRPVISWRWLLLACVALVAVFAVSAVSASEASGENRATIKRAKQVVSIGTSSFSTKVQSATARVGSESALRKRKKRPRVWRMPVNTAKRATRSLTRYLYNNTTPDEFDDSGEIIGNSNWEYSRVGTCKRRSKARVNCIGLLWSEFDVVNDSGQVVDEDTFTCGWEQSTWYPRARVKRLKTKVVDALCFWDSEI